MLCAAPPDPKSMSGCWNCFGQCKTGGNILDFVARKKSVTFRDAAIQISMWFNLPLDEKSSDAGTPHQQKERGSGTPQGRFQTGGGVIRKRAEQTVGLRVKNLDSDYLNFTERGLLSDAHASCHGWPACKSCNGKYGEGHVIALAINKLGSSTGFSVWGKETAGDRLLRLGRTAHQLRHRHIG